MRRDSKMSSLLIQLIARPTENRLFFTGISAAGPNACTEMLG